MNRYLDMTIFQCLNFGKLFSVVFIYVKPTRIYQKTLCCNLFQLGYLYMLVLLYYIYPSIKYHTWSKSELNLANYMSFVIYIEFLSDLDQSGTGSFIRLEMTAE